MLSLLAPQMEYFRNWRFDRPAAFPIRLARNDKNADIAGSANIADRLIGSTAYATIEL